jgi:hypothetical protein
VSEVPKISSEKTKMTTAEFSQSAMQGYLAPPSLGPVKVRLGHAMRLLQRRGWTANRVRDRWYNDQRASAPTWDEINDLEELTGLRYAREELRTNDELIAKADALLMGNDPDFVGAFVAALRTFAGFRNRPGTPGANE